MKIVIINGSPRGINDITAQYVRFLEPHFPEHHFETIEVGRRLRQIVDNPELLRTIIQKMTQADALVWCFPVYFMLVPSQLKRFIELLFESPDVQLLVGKASTAISSSVHFYDHTAHNYLNGVCSDLGLCPIQGYSAKVDDLFNEKERENLIGFMRDFSRRAAKVRPDENTRWPLIHWDAPSLHLHPLPPAVSKTGNKRIVVVSDAGAKDENLRWMIDVFDRLLSHSVELIELTKIKLSGGCLGCMHCADSAVCVYSDDYAGIFDETMAPADVIIYAGTVQDRYLSARFKAFIDRYFKNGHRNAVKARVGGALISGPLNQLGPLCETLEATFEMSHGCRSQSDGKFTLFKKGVSWCKLLM